MTTRAETIEPGFEAHVALPATGSGPGLVLLQEIFGVNDYVKDAARRLAELGYVVLAPDLYWRTDPGLTLGSEDMELAFGAASKLDQDLAVEDAVEALAYLRNLSGVTEGRAGVLGFCLGGTLAWRLAAHSDPDVAVCYYGSGIPGARRRGSDRLSRAAALRRRTIPTSRASRSTRSRRWPPSTSDFECHIQEDAGHAFDNSFAPQFSNPRAAAAAWELTTAFLARTLPPS